jgi:Domain of unknown function (DUF6443)
MPAPNAAALGKYGDYSVGNFTGVPDISIPIYTVQEGPLSLPIGISYHASGIKVGEMASWVGAGWALNAGGIITRTVQGIKDEHANGYFNTATLLETRVNAAATNVVSNGTLNEDIANGTIDGEPDMFSFNVGGYTGKFYIDKARNVQFIPKQDLKLEIDGSLEGFTLIAPDGTRYTFGKDGATTAQEKTLQEGQTGSDWYVTSWYLLKAETPDKKYKINLIYDNEGYSYLGNASIKWNVSIVNTQINSAYDYSSNSGDAYHKTLRTYMSGKKLIQITSSTDTVNFTSSNTRSDLDDDKGFTMYSNLYAKSLDKIEIKTGTKCQKFDFAYTYFQDPISITSTIIPSVTKKLRLESVTQKSCDNTITNPAYTFTYNGNFLAHRLSKAIDHWGFYNGVVANETTIANIPPSTITPTILGLSPISHGNSNRETNETEMMKGILTQIQFPTGGTTNFTYEANTVVKGQPSSPQTRFSLYSCGSAISTTCCGVLPAVTSTFTPNAEDLLSGKFILQVTRPVSTSSGTPLCTNTYNPTTQVNIYLGTTLVGSLGTGLGTNINSTATSTTQSLGVGNQLFSGWVVGTTYTIELVTTSGYASFVINNQPNVLVNRQVGGLRVKEIKTSDGVSAANDIVKQYDYSALGSTNSSGFLLRTPKYTRQSSLVNLNASNGCLVGQGVLFTFSDESIVPMYTFEGNHIGYTYVKETQSGNGLNVGNGTKLYKFIANVPTVQGIYMPIDYPYPTPPLDPVVANGQISEFKIMSTAGTVLKETSNIINSEVQSLSIGKIRKVIKQPFPNSTEPSGCQGIWAQFYTDYQIKTLPYRLSSVTEKLDNVPTTTTYAYSTDATQPLFPLTTSVQNSDGKITVTTNKYITNASYATDPVAIKLKALNMIANPIEVTSTVAGVQVNGAKTEYGFFDVSTGLPLPATSTVNNFPYPFKFYKYKMTWNASGAAQVFGANGGWELEGTINKYSPTKAKPENINLRAWENATATNATEIYTWETNGLIKTRQFKGFTWQYEYLPNTKLVSKIIDKDGQFVTYAYDHLQRLQTATARNGAVKTDYLYTYKDAAQSGRSWIETKTTFTSVIGGTLSNNTTYKTVRQYLDGLGRPVQNVAVANSPSLKDVISVIEYDNQGREFKKYDPFESTVSTGAFVATVPTLQPFSKMEYEASPLSRMWKTTPPNWQASTVEYGTNASNEVYDNTGSAYFAANTLNKVTKTDPDGRVMKTFTDLKGRKVFTLNVQNNVAGGYYMIYGFDDKDRMNKGLYPAWGVAGMVLYQRFGLFVSLRFE